MIAIQIIEILFPIFAIMAGGFIYGKLFKPDVAIANHLNMNIFIPCLLFSVLTEKTQQVNLFGEFALACALVVIFSGIIAYPLSLQLKISPRTLCPPLMFANAGNLGLPLVLLTFGQQALSTAVIMFIVCNFLHITISSYFLDKRSHILRVLFTPMIVSVFAALVLMLLNIEIPPTLLQPISMLGEICVPLMLFTLGILLLDIDFSEWRPGLLVAVLSPLIGVGVALSVLQFVDLNKMQQGVLILFGALPPAVMNYMFAEYYKQEPTRVAAMVLIGNAASIFTLPLALFYVLNIGN